MSKKRKPDLRRLGKDQTFIKRSKPSHVEPPDAFMERIASEPLSEQHPMIRRTDGLKWSTDQLRVLYKVARGESVFFTGCAGTGKSALLQHLRHVMFEGDPNTFVTSTTGVSASAISGTTVHSFAGIGLGTLDVDTLVEKIRKRPVNHTRWMACKRLVIDEVSMLSAELLEKLEAIAREIRAWRMFDIQPSKAPIFGGIQLIICGDFLQLPPVKGEFCFQSDLWPRMFADENSIELRHVFRQRDKDFVAILNQIRHGNMTKETVDLLKEKTKHPAKPVAGMIPTRLFPKCADVEELNMAELDKIRYPVVRYESIDDGDDHSLDAIGVKDVVVMKRTAQVMLNFNLDVSRGLCNGSRGVITSFVPSQEGEDKEQFSFLPNVRFANGVEEVIQPHKFELYMGNVRVATRLQIPLVLAWAMTIHKSQGKTLDYAELHLENVFERAHVYVALSRLKNLEGATIVSFDPAKVKADKDVLAYYHQLGNRERKISQILDECHVCSDVIGVILDMVC